MASIQYEPVNASWFVEDSYTLEYYPQADGWVSFMDYKPNFILGTRDQKLLLFNSRSLYIVNGEDRCTYFGFKYDCYFTPVLALDLKEGVGDKYPFILKSVSWDAHAYNNGMKEFSNNRTFKSIAIHNSLEGMYHELIPFIDNCNLLSQIDTANCALTANRWRYNYIFSQKDIPTKVTYREILDNSINENLLYIVDNKNTIRNRFIDTFAIIKLTYNNQLPLIIGDMGFEITIVKR